MLLTLLLSIASVDTFVQTTHPASEDTPANQRIASTAHCKPSAALQRARRRRRAPRVIARASHQNLPHHLHGQRLERRIFRAPFHARALHLESSPTTHAFRFDSIRSQSMMHSRARSVPLRARVVRASTVVPGDTAREDDARYHRGEDGERVSPPRRHLPSSSASTDGCLEKGSSIYVYTTTNNTVLYPR